MAVTHSDHAPNFDENVAAVVRVLMATENLDVLDLAPRVGMSKSTLYNRMSGKTWTASELDAIAAYFDVSPAVFFRPVQAMRDQNWKKSNRVDLRVFPGGATPLKSSTAGQRAMLFPVPDLPQ